MDSVTKAEKLRAMNCYKNSQFVYNLILSSLVALTCSFFCSHPFGFASLTSSMKYFLFISIPNMWSSFLNPKCLFIVFNVIVAFLVGESKLLGSQSSPANDIYAEYVERSRRLRGVRHNCFSSFGEEKTEERKSELANESKEVVYEDKVIALEQKEDKHDHEKLEEKEEEEDDDHEDFGEAENNDEHEERDREEESDGLPAEELNRRVEDFIARINKQRWLEARMSICGQP